MTNGFFCDAILRLVLDGLKHGKARFACAAVGVAAAVGAVVFMFSLAKTNAAACALAWTPGLEIPKGTDILINATCIGLGDDMANKPDIRYDTIIPDMTVSDVVFNPSDTLFLQEASCRGAQTVNGLGMLACQGARNFTLWTGVEAPLDVMIKKLREEFGEV